MEQVSKALHKYILCKIVPGIMFAYMTPYNKVTQYSTVVAFKCR